MKISERASNLWVISMVNARLHGIRCSEIKEMLVMPNTAMIPGAPAFIRGLINLRGELLPVVDLRKRLQMPSITEQAEALCELLEQRAADHRRWVGELKATVRENRAFTLATDPHKCAFGKWYDNYNSDKVLSNNVLAGNVLFLTLLKRFDAPHKRIHALAEQIKQRRDRNEAVQAVRMIEDAEKGDLAIMLELFKQFQALIRDTRREIAIVLSGKGRNFAVSVDSIIAVEPLAEGGGEDLNKKGIVQAEQVATAVAHRSKSDDLVLLMTADSILDPGVNTSVMGSAQTA
jgi:purine-binding chemotaxis protein CheW